MECDIYLKTGPKNPDFFDRRLPKTLTESPGFNDAQILGACPINGQIPDPCFIKIVE
jgi:hypothetical protein